MRRFPEHPTPLALEKRIACVWSVEELCSRLPRFSGFNSAVWWRLFRLIGLPDLFVGCLVYAQERPAVVTRAELVTPQKKLFRYSLSRRTDLPPSTPHLSRGECQFCNKFSIQCIRDRDVERLRTHWSATELCLRYSLVLGHAECAKVCLTEKNAMDIFYGERVPRLLLTREALLPFGDVNGCLSVVLDQIGALEAEDSKTILTLAFRRNHCRDILWRLLGEFGFGRALPGSLADLLLAEARSADALMLLLERGANPQNKRAFLSCCLRGTLEVLRLLLAKGANVNAAGKVSALGRKMLAIELVIDCGNEDAAVMMIEEFGADLSGKLGMRALDRAIVRGSVKVVNLFLKAGISLDWRTSVESAVSSNSCDMLRLVLDHGGDPFSFRVSPPLHACRTVDMAQLLLDAGADVFQMNELGHPAVISALDNRCAEVARFLLSNGAKIDNRRYPRVLLKAVNCDNAQLISAVLTAGARVDTADEESGMTALMIACWRGRVEVARELLKGGADIEASAKARTALYYAVIGRHALTVKLLLDAGAKCHSEVKKLAGFSEVTRA